MERGDLLARKLRPRWRHLEHADDLAAPADREKAVLARRAGRICNRDRYPPEPERDSFEPHFGLDFLFHETLEGVDLSGPLGEVLDLRRELLDARELRSENLRQRPVDPLLHRLEEHDQDEDHHPFGDRRWQYVALFEKSAQPPDEVQVDQKDEDGHERIDQVALHPQVEKVVPEDRVSHKPAGNNGKEHEQGWEIAAQSALREEWDRAG